MKAPRARKGELSRAHVLDTAVKLFRRRGFDATTMREIADAAGLSLGAAYYYFASKEALLLAYYVRNQEDHEARVETALAAACDLRGRLGVLLHAKLDAVQAERKMLSGLVRRLVDPSDPVSAFADDVASVRARAIGLYARVLADEGLPDDVVRVLPPALWLLHMGLLLYFVNDPSPRQSRTRRLVDDTLDLIVPLARLAASPVTEPIRVQLIATLERAGLLAAASPVVPTARPDSHTPVRRTRKNTES